jgi:hypothetical protein
VQSGALVLNLAPEPKFFSPGGIGCGEARTRAIGADRRDAAGRAAQRQRIGRGAISAQPFGMACAPSVLINRARR